MTNEDAIKEIRRWLDGCPYEETKEAFNLAIKALKERPQGEWIIVSHNCWKCPYCQELTNEGKNFCPNCGVAMQKGG